MQFSSICLSLLTLAAGIAEASPIAQTKTLQRRCNHPEKCKALKETVVEITEISIFQELLVQNGLWESITVQENITVLAPGNAAIQAYAAAHAEIFSNQASLKEWLSVHIVQGTYLTEQIDVGLGTWLQIGQGSKTQINAVRVDTSVSIFSAFKAKSSIVQANIEFDVGVIHTIDVPLTPPASVSVTAQALGLTEFVSGLTSAQLIEQVDVTEQVTIFAPNNAAIQGAGGALQGADNKAVWGYHVVEETLHLKALIKEDFSLGTTAGGQLEVHSTSEELVYINQATVVVGNVPVKNGVLHVIGSVCNPGNKGGF